MDVVSVDAVETETVENEHNSISTEFAVDESSTIQDSDSELLGNLFIEDFSEHGNASSETSSLQLYMGNLHVESADDELRQLLSSLRDKYAGEARHSQCFPENPLRESNLRYIEFDNPAVLNRAGTLDWCTCEHCLTMPTNIESICCHEVENAQPYMENIVCITEHQFFEFYCRQQETVHINMRMVGEVRRPPSRRELNRNLRKTAYRAFTAWIHGFLGMGNRRPIPSCVVSVVRENFPDPEGQYMGFKPNNDPPAEFMPFV